MLFPPFQTILIDKLFCLLYLTGVTLFLCATFISFISCMAVWLPGHYLAMCCVLPVQFYEKTDDYIAVLSVCRGNSQGAPEWLQHPPASPWSHCGDLCQPHLCRHGDLARRRQRLPQVQLSPGRPAGGHGHEARLCAKLRPVASHQTAR